MKHVLIPLEVTDSEKAENFLIARFNERYRKMSDEERSSDIVQDELELLWDIMDHRKKKNRHRIIKIKEELYSRGMLGLTEEEWDLYKRTGKSPWKKSMRRKTQKKKKRRRLESVLNSAVDTTG